MEQTFKNTVLNGLRNSFLKSLYREYKYQHFRNYYLHNEKILKRMRNHDKYKVAFFVIHASVWKCEYIYRLMENNPLFEPVIVVCPAMNFGMDNMMDVMDECYERFSHGYNCIKTYNKETGEFLDIIKEVSPDIIFYTNPYKGLIHDNYYIDKFADVLTCYVPYYISESAEYQFCHNQELHNIVWKIFCETETHKLLAKKYAYNRGINIEVTGYPGVDEFIDKDYQAIDVWKIKDRKYKRIIWAPHHTFREDEIMVYSCFLDYYDLMASMLKKYKDKVQFVFKPHPLLKVKLYSYWGKEKTDEYYKIWEEAENSTFCNGDYTDLFMTSDAMIHDCGSFIAEYLFVDKPALYTIKKDDGFSQYNDFGKECLDVYYHAKKAADIENFIENIIEGKDELKTRRHDFVTNRLKPLNDRLASENILDCLTKSLSEK